MVSNCAITAFCLRMKELEDLIAEQLLSLKAIKFQPKNPFEWNTGWMSPIYFDSRKILSYRTRNIVKLELARLVIEKYPDVEVIAAVAPNAIALGMLVADELDVPFVYVCPRPKDHGFENRIEGELKPKQKVVIVEDQLAVGTNSIKVQEVLIQNGCNVIGMVSVFDYDFRDGVKAFQAAGLNYVALTSFDTVIENALAMGQINDEDAEDIQIWHNGPETWGNALASKISVKKTIKKTKK